MLCQTSVTLWMPLREGVSCVFRRIGFHDSARLLFVPSLIQLAQKQVVYPVVYFLTLIV